MILSNIMVNHQLQYSTQSFLRVKVTKYFQKYFVHPHKISISKNNGLVLYSFLLKTQNPLDIQSTTIELQNYILKKNSLKSLLVKNFTKNSQPEIPVIKRISTIIGREEYTTDKKFLISIKSFLYIIYRCSFKMYILLKKYKKMLFFLFLLTLGYLKRNLLIHSLQKIISYFIKKRLTVPRQQDNLNIIPEYVVNEPLISPDIPFENTKNEVNNVSVDDFFRLFLDNLHESSDLNSNPADLLTDCSNELDKPFTNRQLYNCALNMVEALTFKFCSDAAYELCIDSVSKELNPQIITKCSDKAFDFDCQEKLLHEGLYILYTRCISVLHKTSCSQQLKLVLKRLMTNYLEYQKLNK